MKYCAGPAANLEEKIAEVVAELPIVQPLKKFPAFYGTRRFITVFTRALHWSIS
jgi:hypothetical protein